MISTHLTELLKIRHPILLAPMDVVADGKLAATMALLAGSNRYRIEALG